MESLPLPSESWYMQGFVCALHDWNLFPLVLGKSYNQIPLALQVRFPEDSQSLCWGPRLGSLTWGSKPSQQSENFFGIIVLQFVHLAPSRYGIWFYHDCAPPAISLWLFLSFNVGYLVLVGSSVLLSIVVQKLVAFWYSCRRKSNYN